MCLCTDDVYVCKLGKDRVELYARYVVFSVLYIMIDFYLLLIPTDIFEEVNDEPC